MSQRRTPSRTSAAPFDLVVTDGCPQRTPSPTAMSTKNSTKSPAKAAKPKSPQKPDQMDPEVLEFVQAIDDYKRANGRPFPSWSEVLEIVKALGYERDAA